MNIDADSQCKFAEKLMVEAAAEVPIDARVIIAPHHGSETSGSTCFLEAVNAEFAIFSAGHRFKHPRVGAVDRYVNAGVVAEKVYCKDRSGDDDVEIVIRQDGSVEVAYRLPVVVCAN